MSVTTRPTRATRTQNRLGRLLLMCVAALLLAPPLADCAEPGLFDRDNLVAWCIVPFDKAKRSPEDRAAMVARMGLGKIAYDWRDEHVAEFEREILAYQKHGIEFFAFWGLHDDAFRLFEKYQLHPQIWVMLTVEGDTQGEKIKNAAERLLPALEKAKRLGCQVGLYNHGGWGGEPENMVAVCEYLREHHGVDNVGIVYNLHHGHGHLDRLPQVLEAMKPWLLCLNLNGMDVAGESQGRKILPLGVGTEDLRILRIVRDSGYRGPIGILNHTQEDAEARLLDNLDGLNWLLAQLDGKSAGERPKLRTDVPAAISSDKNSAAGAEAGFALPYLVDSRRSSRLHRCGSSCVPRSPRERATTFSSPASVRVRRLTGSYSRCPEAAGSQPICRAPCRTTSALRSTSPTANRMKSRCTTKPVACGCLSMGSRWRNRSSHAPRPKRNQANLPLAASWKETFAVAGRLITSTSSTAQKTVSRERKVPHRRFQTSMTTRSRSGGSSDQTATCRTCHRTKTPPTCRPRLLLLRRAARQCRRRDRT